MDGYGMTPGMTCDQNGYYPITGMDIYAYGLYIYIYIDIPSSKLTQLWKTTMLLMGKSTMNGYFQ